jgi:hypothetical protein
MSPLRMPLLLACLVPAAAAPGSGDSSVSAPLPAAVPPPRGNWSAGFPGKTFDSHCPDLSNLVHQSVDSCQTVCDSTAGCNAININPHGACALRACPCSSELIPPPAPPSDRAFTAYRRHDSCPPAPLFANVFGSSMVLQRAPLQARLFGRTATALARLTITMTSSSTSGSEAAAMAVITTQADRNGSWACLLPPTPAGGPHNITAAVDGNRLDNKKHPIPHC